MVELSVIVPIYNMEKFLYQCVDSILNQTLKDIEIILVDDGSTDGSGQICEEYVKNNDNIQVLHQKNMGLYGARLAGIKLCSTKYVTFVDADDFIESDAYIHAVDSMRNDMDIILFDIYNYSECLNTKKLCKTVFPYGVYDRDKIRDVIYPHLMWGGSAGYALYPHLVTKVFKKDLLYEAYKLYGNTSQYFGEDTIISYTVIKFAKKIEFVNHAYYNYRARDIGDIPSYISAENFFDEAYSMYKYLRNLFSDEVAILKQVDLLFIEAVNCRKLLYGLSTSSEIRYLFPFDKVEKNKKIVLYGAGKVGKAYYAQLGMINYCKSILWVDKNYEKYHRDDVVSVDNILKSSFDYIVVAVANKEMVKSICEDLISMGIPKESLIMPTLG